MMMRRNFTVPDSSSRANLTGAWTLALRWESRTSLFYMACFPCRLRWRHYFCRWASRGYQALAHDYLETMCGAVPLANLSIRLLTSTSFRHMNTRMLVVGPNITSISAVNKYQYLGWRSKYLAVLLVEFLLSEPAEPCDKSSTP